VTFNNNWGGGGENLIAIFAINFSEEFRRLAKMA
jgi:hypothetical protein